jgi:hypothetical protein
MTNQHTSLKRKAVLIVSSACIFTIAIVAFQFRAHVAPPGSGARVPPAPTPTLPFTPQPGVVLQNAVLTRALGIESPRAITPQLDAMPKGVITRDQSTLPQRLTIWSFFLKGTLIKLGRLNSPNPVIVFYNPLVDVALVQGCHYDRAVIKCDQACALPGESMDNLKAARVPAWLLEKLPMDAFERTAGIRMAVFERDQPADATVSDDWRSKYCSEHLQSEAELRILDAYTLLSGLDRPALTAAIAGYVRQHLPMLAKSQVRAPKRRLDPTLTVLTHLGDFSLSGFLSPTDRTSLVFLTPKKTGWHQAVLKVWKQPTGALEIRGIRVLQLSSHPL